MKICCRNCYTEFESCPKKDVHNIHINVDKDYCSKFEPKETDNEILKMYKRKHEQFESDEERDIKSMHNIFAEKINEIIDYINKDKK